MSANSITQSVTIVIPEITDEVTIEIPTITGSVTLPDSRTRSFKATIFNGHTPGIGDVAGFKLPLVEGVEYDFIVHWRDGTSDHITAWDQEEVTHVFPTDGDYQISCEGTMPQWKFYPPGDGAGVESPNKIRSVDDWGNNAWISMNNAFRGCMNLTSIASGGDFSLVTDFTYAFASLTSLTSFPLLEFPAGTNFSSTFFDCEGLTSFPAIQFLTSAAMGNTFNNCTPLTTIGAAHLGAVTTSTFASCPALASVLATGIKDTTSFAGCNMNAAALNALFTNLETVVSKTITITGNPGAATCTRSIATGKGWTVTG